MAEKDKTVIDHAERILGGIEGIQEQTADKVRVVTEAVLADERIGIEFAGAVIREKSMRARVIRQILTQIGEDPGQVNILAIGDVTVPDFARETVTGFLQKAHELHMESVQDGETGYDLAAKGSEKARTAAIKYFDKHHGFSQVPGLMEKLAKNTCLVHGGMTALDFIAAGHIRGLGKSWKTPLFISADTSFSTWPSIVERRIVQGKAGVSSMIPTKQENGLNITPQDVNERYAQFVRPKNYSYLWYITPVGNPTGTKISPRQLEKTCEAIVGNDPEATILLDCVYVRTLRPEEARELMRGVVQNPPVMDRVIIVESFSKTHGICGERAGLFFSANKSLFDPPQNEMMVLTAGVSRYMDCLVKAISTATPEQNNAIDRMHEFWAAEKRGLFAYLIESGNFTHLFHENQSHINPEDLKRPCGLYLFLKLNNGVNDKDVLLKTGCYGVKIDISSGSYIRFSVGKITEPTYAHYANIG